MDLVEVKENLGAKEIVFEVSPPFRMKPLTESFELAFQLSVKVCLRAINVHFEFVAPARIFGGRVSGIHTSGVLRIADATARRY